MVKKIEKKIEKPRILYQLGDAGRDELFLALSEELQKVLSHEAFFLCSKAGYDLLQGKVVQEALLLFDYENQTEIKSADLEYLQRAEKEFNFNVWDLWELSAQRKKSRRKIGEEKILLWYEYILKKTSEIVDKHKINLYVLYGPASFTSILILKVMEKKKVKVIELQASRIANRFAIANSLENKWQQLEEQYQNLKKNGLTLEEKEETNKILQQYQNQEVKPDCAVKVKEARWNKVQMRLKAGWRMVRYQHYPPSFRPFLWPAIQKVYDWSGIFEQPVEGEKFIFFPLHFQPEISTIFYGKWYNNQTALIEQIVRSMPVGYKLYVKEHSFGYGNRNPSFYREIKKYANVRLISPYSNSQDLIRKSSLIITITGTVGWEGIMLQKPVIALGDVFFTTFDCVKKTETIKNLPILIKETIGTEISRRDAEICLAALLRATYPGLARLPSDCYNKCLEMNNVQLLANGISDYLNKLKD